MNPQQAKMATEFVACMRKLGYDMPEPSDPGFNFSPKDANSMDAQKLEAPQGLCPVLEAGGRRRTDRRMSPIGSA